MAEAVEQHEAETTPLNHGQRQGAITLHVCDHGPGALGTGRSRPEPPLFAVRRSTGWLCMAVLLFRPPELLLDPSSLEKSRRQDEQPELYTWEIPLVETGVARDKLRHAIPII